PYVKEQQRTRVDARAFFEALWRNGDHWELETAGFEQKRFQRQLELLADRHYERALEIGCGAGVFTRQLACLTDHVLAIDVAPAAIERARSLDGNASNIDYKVADVMELDLRAGSPWDLVVLSETIYYLG